MVGGSNITYRIHAQNFGTGFKFVNALSDDFSTISFRTRANFEVGETFILDIRFQRLGEHQYFLVEVLSITPKDEENEVLARFLPGQEQKIRYVYSVAKGTEGALSKRLYPRLPVRMRARWSIGDLDLMHSCEVLDLSYGGAGIRVHGMTVPVGTEISLVIPLTPEESLMLRGQVVWSRDSYMGIRFHPEQEDLRRLRRYLRNASGQALIGID